MRRFIYMNDAPVVPPVSPPITTPESKTFTQDQVNKMMADHKRTLQSEYKKTAEDLQAALEKVNMTAQEKEELAASLDTLKSQHMTEAQKLAAENDKWKKKYETDTKVKDEEAKQWRSRFDTMMITNAIVSGAVSNKGLRPEQFVKMLSGDAKVVQDVDEDGKPTGTFSVKLPVKTKDAKSKEIVVVDLPMAEAIAEMKKDDNFFNLFEEEGKGGLGGSGNARKKIGAQDFHKGMSKEEFGNWFKSEVSNA